MRTIWNYVLLAFCAGLLLGAWIGVYHERTVFHQFWAHGPDTQKILARLNEKLNLTPQQEQEVQLVLEAKREKILSLHMQMRSQFEELRLSMRADMAKILAPEQEAKFTRMTRKWDKRHHLILPNSQARVSSTTVLSSQ